MKTQSAVLAGAIVGMLAVALGAFGAHAFKAMLIASGRLDTFELAVKYQFYHALALVLTGLLQHVFPNSWFRIAAALFLTGIVLFSGSLYLLCFTGATSVAMITPFGGVALISGWALLIGGAWSIHKTKVPS